MCLLDVVESLIGPEINGLPLHHLGMNLPQGAIAGAADGLIGGFPRRHQDSGVLLAEADDSKLRTSSGYGCG